MRRTKGGVDYIANDEGGSPVITVAGNQERVPSLTAEIGDNRDLAYKNPRKLIQEQGTRGMGMSRHGEYAPEHRAVQSTDQLTIELGDEGVLHERAITLDPLPHQRVRRGAPRRAITLYGLLMKGDNSNPVINEYWKKYALFRTQDWISEMASYVKSIDRNHLLEAGLEGFYGATSPKKQFNPGYQVGTDFIANNRIYGIDFATVHSYPDQWVSRSDNQAQLSFLNNWLDAHIQDAQNVLRKPLLLAEFGKSWKDPGFNTNQRDVTYNAVYSKIYSSARSGGATAGGLFWQLLAEGMDSFRDGYEIVLSESPSTANMIAQQSRRLYQIRKMFTRLRNIEKWKKARAIRRAQGFN
ncbi:hypothetical protein GIB67_002616 [Kingdonia uniflora]|uniref:mannan endo-1,4-beta-mannosidase n=1 Tax=Kingdonia uniflora TaxID=39325 RepID=A0A7J7N4H6_9MAGN|nr:hypothetical protein GIB67_002616 [Kingdonia uniflora]